MKNIFTVLLMAVIPLCFVSCKQEVKSTKTESEQVEKEINHKEINTPDEALQELIAGNKRFLDGKTENTSYQKQIDKTKDDQHPHTVILSCMDSRVPPEIIFDQGLGDLFVIRIAGNIQDANVLGSMEYAAKVKETKLILVMGHSNCGAVEGAIDRAELGNLTQLVKQIEPAIPKDTSGIKDLLSVTVKNNVNFTIEEILKNSPTINELLVQSKIKILGAYYDISTGTVEILNAP